MIRQAEAQKVEAYILNNKPVGLLSKSHPHIHIPHSSSHMTRDPSLAEAEREHVLAFIGLPRLGALRRIPGWALQGSCPCHVRRALSLLFSRRINRIDTLTHTHTHTHVLICCGKSLNEIIATVYAFILLLLLSSICSRQHFDKVFEVGVAKVAAFRLSIVTFYKASLHDFTYAMLYREGYVLPSFRGGSTTR